MALSFQNPPAHHGRAGLSSVDLKRLEAPDDALDERRHEHHEFVVELPGEVAPRLAVLAREELVGLLRDVVLGHHVEGQLELDELLDDRRDEVRVLLELPNEGRVGLETPLEPGDEAPLELLPDERPHLVGFRHTAILHFCAGTPSSSITSKDSYTQSSP